MKAILVTIFIFAGVTQAQVIQSAAARAVSYEPSGSGVEATAFVSSGVNTAAAPMPDLPSLQDDPGLTLYKAGYSAILSKQWTDARKKFEELLRKYPRSKYVDAAEYWNAYALAQTDRRKGADAYRKFIRKYKGGGSEYLDDAVADMQKFGFNPEEAEAGVGLPPVPPVPPVVTEPVIAETERIQAEAAEIGRAHV